MWSSLSGRGRGTDGTSNHRGITLLSIPGKVLAHIFLRRIRDHLLRHQRLEQSGFTPGKSTKDRTLALRVIVERHREFGRGLLAAYIDLKNAPQEGVQYGAWGVTLGDPEAERNFNKDYWTNSKPIYWY